MGEHPATRPYQRRPGRFDSDRSGPRTHADDERISITVGHHNENLRVAADEDDARRYGVPAGTLMMVRTHRWDDAPLVTRTFFDEGRFVRSLGGSLLAPVHLGVRDESEVYTYVVGDTLRDACPDGQPVRHEDITALAATMAAMTAFSSAGLPPLPLSWPRDIWDSRGFLQAYARLSYEQIVRPNLRRHGWLFRGLGVPDEALAEWADRVPAMTRRPFCVLHGDLHRANLIRCEVGCPRFVLIDWELATYGDPLHDLAVHLVRMRYPAWQWRSVISAWRTAMLRLCPAAVADMDTDLCHYLDFERAQSVYPDVIRAVRDLGRRTTEAELTKAVKEVRRALLAAAGPLRLTDVADERRVEELLRHHMATDGRTVDGLGGGQVNRPRVPSSRSATDVTPIAPAARQAPAGASARPGNGAPEAVTSFRPADGRGGVASPVPLGGDTPARETAAAGSGTDSPSDRAAWLTPVLTGTRWIVAAAGRPGRLTGTARARCLLVLALSVRSTFNGLRRPVVVYGPASAC
ncbi:phosphotransferase [Streptomyces sp. CRN 30]|uniref:phosphotransferase n=1 Tax=Streptomyces sp. CRN 30 TaxID=3075613 RepID=UPI002A80F7AB|nr:phosphotransferase [Streptomyces sp. CRN 30]